MFAERIWFEKKKQTPTNMELEKGGVGEGGAVELRFACGGTVERGLCFGGRRR